MTRSLSFLAGLALALPLAATPAFAEPITITDAYLRVAGPVAKAGGAFMAIENTGPMADRLIGATTEIARKVELHTHLIENGVMKMREVEGGIPLPAGETVMLERGGLHVMLMGLTERLKDGDAVELTLDFETAPDLTLILPVQANAKH